jgi:hypothetical protein
MVSSISGYSAVNQLLLYRRDTSIGARKKIMMYIGLSKRLDALPIKDPRVSLSRKNGK